jgi:peroxiredoxin
VGTTVGHTAPGFTLQDLNGQSVTLSDLRGTHVVLIDFWATWCGPCKQELPHVQEMYVQYKDRGFTVLAINARESANQARGFINDNNYTFPVLLDRKGEVLQQYGVRGIPSAFIVDTRGVIQKVQVGYRTGVEADLARKIESLLPR